DDSITAGAGGTVLDGAGGNDTLVGGSGPTTLLAGGGNDLLVAGSGGTIFRIAGAKFGNIVVDPPAGSSGGTLDFSAFGGPVSLDLGSAAPQVIAGGKTSLTLTLQSPLEINALVGSAFGDQIISNSGGVRFYLGSGNDSITGAGGADEFYFTG